jgi:phage I-like protein
MRTSKDIAVQVAEFIINDTKNIRGMDSCLNELLTDYEHARAMESTKAPEAPVVDKTGAKVTKGRKKWL